MILCLRRSFSEVLQEDMKELFSQNQTGTKSSPPEENQSPRQKKVLLGRVDRKCPIIEHARLEEEMSLEELTLERLQVWDMAADLTPSFHGCFEFGVRPDVGTLGTYEPLNTFYVEQKALGEGRIPLKLLQMKYHPERPYDKSTGESYLEQVGTPIYRDNGVEFDIPYEKLADESWTYNPEEWITQKYKNNQTQIKYKVNPKATKSIGYGSDSRGSSRQGYDSDNSRGSSG